MLFFFAKLKSFILSHRGILLFLFAGSLFAILAAYISEYFFAMKPCILCLYQRKPFFLVIALASCALFLPYLKRYKILAIELSIIALLVNIFIASYHLGVEKNFFKGPSSCSGINSNPSTIEELKIALNLEKPVPCNKPQFVFLKISMAGWNVIYCFGLVFLSLILLFKVKNLS